MCLVLMLFPLTLSAVEVFRFNIGDEIWIQAEKSYTQGEHKNYFATGNVVINHQNETLYGESASVDKETGEVRIWGNVRYIAKDLTLYGSELRYNLLTGEFDFQNARIISTGYSIVGKHVTRSTDGTYLATDAEFTTCRDCPESWVLMGGKIKLTATRYVHIQHAFIKSNGAILMYVPYISIPLKRERETGLLFPLFHYQPNMGMIFQQPWFWAISPSSDLTLTPSLWGRRGPGGEIEYRQVLGEAKWFQLNSMGVNDRVYLPNRNNAKTSGGNYNRFFGTYEHHYQLKNNFTHHLHYSATRDLDIVRDFHDYTKTKAVGSELGLSTFFEFRQSYVDASVQTYLARNMLINDAMEFDESYVQILPKFSLEMVPISLLHTSIFGLQNLALGAYSTHTVFKQNHFEEEMGKRRNALRTTVNPYLDWNLGQLGPFNLKSLIEWDYQHYQFRKLDQENFSKRGTVFTTEFNFEVQKILGMAYEEKIPVRQLTQKSLKEVERNANLEKEQNPDFELKGKDEILGDLPDFETQYTEDYITNHRNSYRHSQVFRFLHYYTSDQSFAGNRDFRKQISIQRDLFDYEDAVRFDENSLGSNLSRTLISTKNSVEFQWNNSLIRKSPHNFDVFKDERILLDNFEYAKVAYFEMSQALRLNTQNHRLKDDVERLHLSSGFSLGKWTFSADEYYFYQNSKHQLFASVGRNFKSSKISMNYEYNGFSSPRRRYLTLEGKARPVDPLEFQVLYRQDMERKKRLNTRYTVIYRPPNNCWALELSFMETALQRRFGFNFFFNFGDNKFNGV